MRNFIGESDDANQDIQDKCKRVGWLFWLLWVVATTLGMFVGFFLGFLLIALTGFSISVFGLILGIIVGLFQWLVLRRRISEAKLWIFASAIGSLGIIQAGEFFGYSTSYASLGALIGWIVIVALAGIVTGILQWEVLREQVSRAGLWVLASCVGWTLSVIGVRALPWGGDDSDALWGMTVTGAVLGALTGGVLVWLLRHPTPGRVDHSI